MELSLFARRTLEPLDGLRLFAFRHALKSRVLSSLVVLRERRLLTLTALHASVAFGLAVGFPVLLFVLGPVLLGVAHVAADVRYLVLRRSLPSWWRSATVVACTLLFASGVVRWLAPGWSSERSDFVLVVAWALAGVAAGALASRSWVRAGVAVALALGIGALAWGWPSTFRLVFVHAHNLVALAVWPLFYRSRPKRLLLLTIPIVALAALLASGALAAFTLATPGVRQFGVHALDLARTLAPSLRSDHALGVTSSFVFLQAVHYSIWLGVVPQGEQPGQGTLSFRQSARSLLEDFGPPGLCLVALAAAAVSLGGYVNAPRAAATYMRLAMFHGYLELVLLLHFWVARARLQPELPKLRES